MGVAGDLVCRNIDDGNVAWSVATQFPILGRAEFFRRGRFAFGHRRSSDCDGWRQSRCRRRHRTRDALTEFLPREACWYRLIVRRVKSVGNVVMILPATAAPGRLSCN